jgi:ABC-type multidrug transport system fused ATPase/permease subunit
MRKLLRYYLPYKRLLLLALVCNILMSVFMVVSIPVLQPFLQILFNSNNGSAANNKTNAFLGLEGKLNHFFSDLIHTHGQESALLIVCIFLVLTFLGKNLFRYLSLYFLAGVRNGIVKDLRIRMMQKVLDLPLSYFSDTRKGDLMSRMTSDVQEIEWSIVGVVESIAREPIVIIGSLAFMIAVSPQLLLFVLVLMVFSGLIIGGIGQSLRRQSAEAQRSLGGIGAMIDETLGGLRILKGFNAEQWQNDRFERESSHYMRAMNQINRKKDLASPLSEFLGIGVVSILLWFGSRQVFAGTLSAATFITFLYAFYNVIEPAKSLSGAFYSIRKGMGALERVQHLLDAPISIKEPETPIALDHFNTCIEFNNVRFRYDNTEQDTLRGISFKIPQGKIVALVGASGSGKSTIADLLPRFHDINSGEIRIDGKDIRQVNTHDLRALMGIVSQEAILFNDSVRSNIIFGAQNATEEEVISAAKAANAHDFIIAMPMGYDSNIGDRGSKLSGGQRQRLTIARALLKNPPILILDEATSALDSESEQLVQSALDRLLVNRTALVIAHRLSTIQHADEIIVMDEGKIVERGTHEGLMEGAGVYRRLVELQNLS